MIDSAGLSTYGFNADGSIASRLDDADNSYVLTPGTTNAGVSTTSNRLSSTTGVMQRTYSFDAAGNTTGDGSATFTYNFANRMGSATKNGVTGTYTYNALGQRIRKNVGGATTYFVYDEAGHLLGQYDGAGAVVEEIVWMGDIPVASVRPAGAGTVSVYYIHTDHLNTPRRVSRPADNQIVWRWDSDPYGEASAREDVDGDSQAFAFHLRFPGQFMDLESGLHYNYFRDYDPVVGRYSQSDPVGLGGGLNTYAYVNGNPVGDVDPTGELGLLGGILGGLGDLAYQLYRNGGNLNCVNWWEVGSWALTGSGAGIVGRGGLTGVSNFFSNADKFNKISRGYWGARGGANGMSLDHWMFSQAAGRSGAVSERIVNGGWNLLEMPRSWNTWLGFAQNWGGAQAAAANAARVGRQVGVPSFSAASIYAGYEIGTNAQQEQCGCE